MNETPTQTLFRLESQLEYITGVLERKLDINQRRNVKVVEKYLLERIAGLKLDKMAKPLIPQPLMPLGFVSSDLCTKAMKLGRETVIDRIKLLELRLEAHDSLKSVIRGSKGVLRAVGRREYHRNWRNTRKRIEDEIHTQYEVLLDIR